MNKHIDNILKSIDRQKKGLRDPQIMHPERDWPIGIFIAILIFIATGVWSLTLYLENRNASVVTQTEEQSESVVYRESMVEEALGRLEERAAKLASLLPRTAEPVIEETVEEIATSTEEIAPVVEEEIIEPEEEEDAPIEFQ